MSLNSKDNKNLYFDIHDESLVTHGIPGNFSTDKKGLEEYYNEVWRAFSDSYYKFDHIIIEGNEVGCMFSMTGIHKEEFMGIPPSHKQIKVDGMIFFLFKDSKIVERWEIIDMLSLMKQLGARQQLTAVKNAILEYAEVKTNEGLKSKINRLFGSHD